ncbi:MAG TPA: hypothetical protein VIJ90_00820 [Gemmatimonadaceae bacterium]
MLIKNARHAAAVLALVIFAIPAAQAQTGTQNVAYSVASIQRIAVSGGTQTLAIVTATPGTALTSISNSAASYAIWNNVDNMKITASLDGDMPGTPGDLVLKANLTAPAGATSTTRSLSTTAADMVIGINKLSSASPLGITYTLDALPAAGAVSGSVIVTYTVTLGS